MPESIETTINVTIPIPMRRQSLVNPLPQVIEEKESFAELTIGNANPEIIVDAPAAVECIKEVPRKPKQFVPPIVEIDPTQEGVEKSTGLRITGGADFNMPITIFHVRNLKFHVNFA